MFHHRSTSYTKMLLAAGLLAGTASTAATQEPPRLDGFLSPAVREAFAAAAGHDELWQMATRDGEAYLRERGVEVPPDLSVSYLNVQRQGDWVIWADGRFAPLLEMYCPPTRTWWQECRKVMRVCETKKILFCRPTTSPDPKDPCYPKESAEAEIEVNCHTVCESSIWDKEFTLPTLPPFPPLPFGGR
jgi:hypothetical protein